MPFGVNSDPSFRAQRQRIRVRGCVFSYRRDSTVLALTNSETLTCFVSEPDLFFLRFSLCGIFLEKSGGETSRKNKGVLDRPWTKRMVLRAISSTLKLKFTVNPESQRFDYSVRQKIGDPGPIKLRTIFPHTPILSKPPQLPYGANKSSFS